METPETVINGLRTPCRLYLEVIHACLYYRIPFKHLMMLHVERNSSLVGLAAAVIISSLG